MDCFSNEQKPVYHLYRRIASKIMPPLLIHNLKITAASVNDIKFELYIQYPQIFTLWQMAWIWSLVSHRAFLVQSNKYRDSKIRFKN